MDQPARMAPHQLKAGGEGEVGKMGLEQRAQTATHPLKAGQGRRRREQDGIGGMGTDGNSPTESRAGKKAT